MRKEMTNPRQQRGAILVVSLVLLLVMTVLGISTMNTASLELNMAGNDQFFENAFQMAESGIDQTVSGLNNGAPVPPPLNPGVCPAFNPWQAVPAMNGQFRTLLCFQGDIPDFSGGSSIGKIRQFHYVNRSEAQLPGPQARSFHHQGLFVRGPDGI
ncbi:MAG: PilX N-terminal domain-containing pilus assembly protein [Gammaproteobacteria bacterium]|nr:PilX N-terminal domain-containing pilus assembly protein [Gammaproteobacteria bacterium]